MDEREKIFIAKVKALGDIAVSTSEQVTYRRLDAAGNPDSVVNSLPDVRNGTTLSYMLT